MLKQLEKDGWVTRSSENTAGKQKRNLYLITEAGRDALRAWLLLPPETPQSRYEFLLKMFFSDEIPIETILTRMIQSKAFCEGILKEYQAIEARLENVMIAKGKDGESLFFRMATLRYGLHDMKAKIAWCAEVIEHLESRLKRSTENESRGD